MAHSGDDILRHSRGLLHSRANFTNRRPSSVKPCARTSGLHEFSYCCWNVDPFMANLAELVPVVVQPDRNINAVLTPKPGYRVCIQILNHEYAVQYNTIQYKICKAPCCRGFRGAGKLYKLYVYYKHTDRRTDGHADCNTSLPYREWPGGVAVSYTHLTLPTIYSV